MPDEYNDDLAGQVWENSFALQTVNILFIKEIQKSWFKGGSARQWMIVSTNEFGECIVSRMLVFVDEMNEMDDWIKIV